jgi:hypothetical protein
MSLGVIIELIVFGGDQGNDADINGYCSLSSTL